MTRHTHRPRTLATFAFLSAVAFAAAPASAHVTLEQREANPGASYKAVFKVPHGCDGQSTHTVRVEFPEGFVNVKPMPKPGWTLATERAAYGASYSVHGHTVTEGVKTVTWSGGDLPDAYYDEFVAAGFIGKDMKPGPIYFKVTQTCADGEIAWIETPDGISPKRLSAPAPVLQIAEAKGDGAGHGHHHHDHGGHTHGEKDATSDSASADGTATIGALSLEGGWARETPAGAKVGAGYITIRNTGGEADVLLSISAPVAGTSEIHDMTMTDDGVMKMRALAEGIEIPAGGTVDLKPGGKHMMFMDLKEPLVAGASVALTLTFKSGASGTVILPVRPIGGGSKKDAGDGHEYHHHH